MNQHQLFTCPDCNNTGTSKGSRSVLYTCTACSAVLVNQTELNITKTVPPNDWSIVQIGSTGTFSKKNFEVIGLVRMQLRKEYKNYWCLWYPSEMKYGWMVESLGFYAVCADTFIEMDNADTIKKIRATASIQVSPQSAVIIDEVDFCEELSFRGEVPTWSYDDRFLVAHGKKGHTIASFLHFSRHKDRVKFLVGEWITFESLQLKNINTSHVW